MTSALPFARGILDSMPAARESVDPLDLLRGGRGAIDEGARVAGLRGDAAAPRPLSGVPGSRVSAFLVEPSGLVAVVEPGGAADPPPVRRPGSREGSDTDTPFATSSETLALWRPPADEALELAGLPGGADGAGPDDADADGEAERAMLMGRTADGTVHVAVRVPGPVERPGVTWANIRWCGHLLSDDDSALALQAVALVRWHAQYRFCSRCGQAVRTISAGWATMCPGCGTIEYPRQDPAVIMAVVDDQDRVLMAHNSAWREGFWSVLAGFVEAGESPDRTVRREVLEEVGLRVGDVRPFAAQPWPMPRSLMLGYTARLEPGSDAEPHPDGAEIDHARFFTRAELAEAISSGQVEPPGPTAIARYLLEDWFGGTLPASPRSIDALRRR
jgi:NAD+ diphosphatase